MCTKKQILRDKKKCIKVEKYFNKLKQSILNNAAKACDGGTSNASNNATDIITSTLTSTTDTSTRSSDG